MVHFTGGGPIFGRRLTCLAFEEAVKIGGVGKAQVVGDLLQGMLGVEEHAFGFEYEASVDMRYGRLAALGFYDFAEVAGGNVQQGCVIADFMQLAEVFFDPGLEVL